MRVAKPHAGAAPAPAAPGHGRMGVLGWLPLLVIGAGLAAGLVLWAKWGFLIAFETIRSYCF